MKVRQEFSKHAAAYGERNVIQREVAKKLLSLQQTHPRRVLDIGCGSGTIYSLIDWEMERFVGIDFSQGMLLHHPHSDNIDLRWGDFNDPALFESLRTEPFDHIYSSSALQWGEDLNAVFHSLSELSAPLSLAIFTSGTFKTLHECAQVAPLLRSADEVIRIADQNFQNPAYEVLHYTLSFDSVREMFRYIKRSGVSGGRKILTVSQMKQLMESYPLEYLEFEVLLITAK